MKTTSNTKKLIYAGLFIALGVLLPQIIHLAGSRAAGSVFLPMHIPVILCGMLLGPLAGSVTGILSPLISFLATGMPPFAILPFMVFELATYGVAAGFLYKKAGLHLFLSLLLTQLAGRAVNALSLIVATHFLQINAPPVASVLTALATGAPGIFIQLALIPSVILSLKKAGVFNE